MKKKLIRYAIIGFLGVLAIIGILSEVIKQKPAREAGEISNEPEKTKNPSSDGLLSVADRVTISGVEVNNFLGTGQASDKEIVTVKKTENYTIIYHTKTSLFLISILSSPFREQRALAELEFIEKLGIEKEDACKLNVSITTPRFANEAEAGKNYKLSFCE